MDSEPIALKHVPLKILLDWSPSLGSKPTVTDNLFKEIISQGYWLRVYPLVVVSG